MGLNYYSGRKPPCADLTPLEVANWERYQPGALIVLGDGKTYEFVEPKGESEWWIRRYHPSLFTRFLRWLKEVVSWT